MVVRAQAGEGDDVDPETQAISEALALIDRGLGDMQRRSLVSGDEVANLLLDVRLLLMLSEEAEPQLN